jgi:hypothetical protein
VDDEVWTWPDSLDPLVAAPETHSLLFENDELRVLETRIAPGATLVDTREGTVPEAGTAVWSPALPPHSLENVGPAEIHVIGVELKG